MDKGGKNCQACGGGGMPDYALFLPEEPTKLDGEQEELKRQIYERMNPRRRKFVDRIGYDQWDPFQAPNDPLDIRRDRTNRTLQQLMGDFLRQSNGAEKDAAWRKGALECAMGIIKKDEKFQGIFDFCLWYHALLQNEEGKK